MDQIDTLGEAAQAPNVTGALQQLMLSRGQAQPQQVDPRQQMQQTLLQRASTPQQARQVDQQRESALQAYQKSLLQPAMGNYTPTEHGLYSWLENMGKTTSPFDATARGIGAGGRMWGEQEAARQAGVVNAAKAGYSDAVGRDTLDSRELSNLRMGAAGASAGAALSAEKILPLYGKIFNSYSQQAKDMQFADPAERTEWIRRNTDEAMRSAVSQFGGAVSPAVLNQLFTTATGGDVSATRNIRSIDPIADEQSAAGEISSASPPGMPSLVFPGKTREYVRGQANKVANPTQRAELLHALDAGQPILQDFPGGAMSNTDRAKFSQLTPQGTPPFKNKPNETLMNEGSKGMADQYAKEYAVMADAAIPAKDQLDAYNTLEKIDPNTSAFANVQGYVGTALQGLGLDPNAPIIQDAIKNRQAVTLISQMSNAALRGEKGVQTRSDEVRIGNELARTTDPKQAWTFLVKLGKERAQRKIDAAEFAAALAEANNGVPIAPRVKFVQSVADDPLTQDFGGKTIFRTPTIEAYLRKYPDADKSEAVEYWRSLEQGWNKRRQTTRTN